VSWEPRTGNPGGRGTPSSRADVAARLEDLTELDHHHEDVQLIATRLGVSVRTIRRYRARLRDAP
jgi:Trp operon repressor